MLKKLFSVEEVIPATRTFEDPTRLVNYFAEGAITRLSNGLYEKLEAGTGPRYLRYGLASHCRCLGCHAWQIVELDSTGGKTIIDEAEDLMDLAI